MTVTHHWTVADLEQLPDYDDKKRYEIVGGELYVSTQPHFYHQQVCSDINVLLAVWNRGAGLGRAIAAPGVILSEEDAVAPDVIWISNERFLAALGSDGKLHLAPELMVEVLSEGSDNELRDREIKLALYSQYRVAEYWLVDWRARSVDVYRLHAAELVKVGTVQRNDLLQSPLLPGFSCEVESLFAGVPEDF